MPRLAYAFLASAVALGGCIVDTDDDRGGSRRWGNRDYSDFYSPRRKVVCDEDSRVCYRNGDPSRKATRREFGKKAARRVDRW